MVEQKMDLRIERTYKSLCEALTRLLAERHYEDITVSDLCDEAMIRRTTFYKHFADKDEFFAFYVRSAREQIQVESAPADGGEESILAFSMRMDHAFVQWVETNDALVQTCIASSAFYTLDHILFTEIYRSVAAKLEAAVLAGERFCVAPDVLGRFYAGGILRILYAWKGAGDSPHGEWTSEEVEAELASLCRQIFAQQA